MISLPNADCRPSVTNPPIPGRVRNLVSADEAKARTDIWPEYGIRNRDRGDRGWYSRGTSADLPPSVPFLSPCRVVRSRPNFSPRRAFGPPSCRSGVMRQLDWPRTRRLSRVGRRRQVREITIEIDRHGKLDVEGLSVCGRKTLEALGAEAARRTCAASMVGSGSAGFDLGSSEPVSVPLGFFNCGASTESPTLLVQAALPPPDGPLVSAMRFELISHGRYSMKAVLPIPRIDEGRGRLASFTFRINRRFRFEGQRESYASARCIKGALSARLGVGFEGGTNLAGEMTLPCTPVHGSPAP